MLVGQVVVVNDVNYLTIYSSSTRMQQTYENKLSNPIVTTVDTPSGATGP